MKAFFDCDVILDLLTRREPYHNSSVALFTLVDERKIKGFTSSLVFSNIYYILSKMLSKTAAISSLTKVNILLKVLSVDQTIISLALTANFNDFEDAIQYYAALEGKVDCIVTRNKKDYKKSKLPIYSPDELLSLILND